MTSKILVIGDMMLDKFSYGKVKRLNPEGPNPLLHIEKEEFQLGGAANVAANIASLLGEVDALGCVGDDLHGEIFTEAALGKHIHYSNIDAPLQTLVKQRFIETTYNQQILRVDYEKPVTLSPKAKEQIIATVQNGNYELIVFSDYNKGIFEKELFQVLQEVTQKKGIKILVDSKPINYADIQDVYLLKPNFKEFCEMIGTSLENSDSDIEKYGSRCMKEKKSNLLITRGEKGATLIEQDGRVTHIRAIKKQVFDVTGAGDTYIATLSYGLSTGKTLLESAKLGNIASSIIVAKTGTQTISLEELFPSPEMLCI